MPSEISVILRRRGAPSRRALVAYAAGSLRRLSMRKLRGTGGASLSVSDAVGAQRRKAVEPDGGIARGVGAGCEDLDLVADLQLQWQPVFGALVEDVGAVAGRAGNDDRALGAAAPARLDAVFDALAHRLGEAVELADVEIDPASVAIALVGDQHDLALDNPGIADQRAARLDDDLGQIVAEMPGQRIGHRLGIARDPGDFTLVMRREAAADIDHAQVDIGLGERGEHARGGADRAVPLPEIGLLRADMERDPVWVEAEIARFAQQHDRHRRGAAELARQRPVGAGAGYQDAAEDARAGRGARQLFDLGLAVESEEAHAALIGEGNVALLLDRVAEGQALGRGTVA